MTTQNQRIWRGAYDLYEWNHLMEGTDEDWQRFINGVTQYAYQFDWQHNPLVRALAFGILDAVQDEFKQRKANTPEPPEPAQSPPPENQQLTFLP